MQRALVRNKQLGRCDRPPQIGGNPLRLRVDHLGHVPSRFCTRSKKFWQTVTGPQRQQLFGTGLRDKGDTIRARVFHETRVSQESMRIKCATKLQMTPCFYAAPNLSWNVPHQRERMRENESIFVRVRSRIFSSVLTIHQHWVRTHARTLAIFTCSFSPQVSFPRTTQSHAQLETLPGNLQSQSFSHCFWSCVWCASKFRQRLGAGDHWREPDSRPKTCCSFQAKRVFNNANRQPARPNKE